MKKGDIWISAVMYIALGVVVLSIILAAAMPVITKLRDKNTALQTKELLFKLDETIRTVFTEGPGSKRAVKIQLGRGDFVIDEVTDRINWTTKTKVVLSEPGTTVKEGNLNILTNPTKVTNEYETSIWLDYLTIADIQSKIKKLAGSYNLIIQNSGVEPGCITNCRIRVTISEAV